MSGFSYKSNIKKAKKAISDAKIDILNKIGLFVSGQASLNSPVDTGNLRRSYSFETDEREKSVKIGSPVEYSPFVELGTSHNKAQPHLRPAVEENINKIKDIAREGMDIG